MTRSTDFGDMYRAFEDRFRGPEALIRERLSRYLPLIELIAPDGTAPRRALDVGCGRGEWLALLRDNGWQAVGVDSNVSMAEVAVAHGLDIVVADAIAYLAGCPDGSLSLVTAFHVVEHLSQAALTALLHEIARVLAPGGMVILETPNPENLTVSTWSFYMDPTHEKPLPPALLQFQAEAAGLYRPLVLRLNALYRTETGELPAASLVAMLGNAPDYAIVATRASADPQVLAAAVEGFVAKTSDPMPADIEALVVARAQAGRHDIRALREETASLLRRHDEMAVEVAALRARLQNPRLLPRGFVDDRYWLVRGARAWLGFRPGSRPRRVIRKCLLVAQRLVRHQRWLHALASRLLALTPRAQRHVFKMLSPGKAVAPPFPPFTVLGCTIAMPSDGELIAIERLSHAAEMARGSTDAASGRNGARPRLAYISPFPPDRSGIAGYAAMLLPELSQFYDIDVISAGIGPATEQTNGLHDWTWFERHYGEFDRIIYQLGNSHFHAHMPSLLRKIPGIVVIHDFYLGDLLHSIIASRKDPEALVQALYRSHGFTAAARHVLESESVGTTIETYPASFSVLAEAQGVIAHGSLAKALAANFYPALDTHAWRTIPLVRVVPDIARRSEARVELGFGPDAFIVCSFGHVGSTKCYDTILDAWQASAMVDDPSCHLVFVGEVPDNDFGRAFRQKLNKAGGNVRATGYATEAEYASYLAAADASIQLRRKSRGETSAAVLDSLGHGIPTIVNAHGSFNELPDEIVRKLPDDVTAADIAQALDDFRAHPEQAQALGAAAHAYVKNIHAPSQAARSYHDAIEHFHTSAPPIANAQALRALARDSLDDPGESRALLKRIAELGRAADVVPQRRLFVDVSATARDDLRTGIQRVVRALLLELIKAPPDGYRVEPVLLHNATGRWLYAHARDYACATLGLGDIGLKDTRVVPRAGDILLVADYFCLGVIDAAAQNVYREWRDAGVSIQFVVYDMLPALRPDWFPPAAGPAHEKWTRVIAREGDRLICISNAVADETRRWLAANGAPTVDVHGWALGADMDATSPTRGLPADAAEILAKIRRSHSFLMVGTVEPRKGHLQALAAFEQLWEQGSDAQLVIVGSEGWKGSPVESRRNLPNIMERLNGHPELGRKLIWLKGVSDEFLDRIYASARCLLAASEGEGFGLPLIEAARHGIPIMARDIPVFREVGGPHAAYFTAADPSALAAAVRHWLVRHEAGERVLPGQMRWQSWAQSVERLKKIVLKSQDDDTDGRRTTMS